jgi:hypothetical protein
MSKTVFLKLVRIGAIYVISVIVLNVVVNLAGMYLISPMLSTPVRSSVNWLLVIYCGFWIIAAIAIPFTWLVNKSIIKRLHKAEN